MKIYGRVKNFVKAGIRYLEDPLIRDKLKNRIHCVENDKVGILFHRDDISIYTCPKPLKRALIDFLEGASRHQACQKYSIHGYEFDSLLRLLLQKQKPEFQAKEQSAQDRILDRLVLNIANSCNLECRYCYARGSAYGSVPSIMSKKTALAAVDRFCVLYDGIDKLQFFGGEPLLNPEIMSFVCEELARKREKGEIKKIPQFSMVTNGTIISEKIFKLLKKYNIKPTISMDGPQIINDDLRGVGTTRKSEKFIHHLEKYGIGYSFEGTFTSRHLDAGIYLNHLMDFFSKRFGQREVHIPPASLPKESPLFLNEQETAAVYREGVEISLANIRNGATAMLSFASRILDVFMKKEPINNYCPAGLYTLSVDTKGTIYPCFMFTGMEDFQMGNVLKDPCFVKDKVEKVFRMILADDKPNNVECQECWALPFCSGCLGADYIMNSGEFTKKNCVLTKAMVEVFLAKVPEILDPSLDKGIRGSHEN